MKKIYLLISICLFSSAITVAQSNMMEQAPGIQPNSLPSATSVTPWQLLFNQDLAVAGAGGGNAGVVIFNNEFWISRWQQDTILTLDMLGNVTSSFVVPGVTGVRSLTTDGVFIYAGANTAQIIQIDPVTKTLITTINTAAVANVRYCTYDASANSGAGGFCVGTWATDITLVDMLGNALLSIGAPTHGLTACYGMAYDGASPGGPYLWAFHQTGTANAADIIQINILSGMQTGVMHDVSADIATPGNLAGGLHATASPLALTGLLQGNPTGAGTNYLFTYDINLTGIAENAAAASFVSAYPNPASGMVNIGVKRTNNDAMQMQIVDAVGKVVYESANVGISNYVNMAKYETGIYTVRISHNGETHTTKIVRN